MHISEFDFDLPERLIAQYPPEKRGESRLLLALDRPFGDAHFSDLPDYIERGDVLVFNNTKVIKARLFGQKASGGKIEVLIERVLDSQVALAHIRASKSPKSGAILRFADDIEAQMQAREGELFRLHFSGSLNVYEILARHGHLPLPPYITHAADAQDEQRYQTVYAKHQGAVAAPTAGLHFTEHLLHTLREKGVEMAEITLHVGAGTFQPVRVEQVRDHQMHHEWFDIPESTIHQIRAAKQRGNRVWAVGTTSLRALETAAISGFTAGQGDTNIFITPGFEFRVVDGLITNFHLPKSTLFMLVCAFSGQTFMHEAYQHAIAQGYRFFSYGDAMLLKRTPNITADLQAA